MTSESTDVQFEYDKSVVGVDVELGSFEITPEQVKAYCEALEETNPLYADGTLAPPGIFSSVSFGRGQGLDAKVQFGNASFMAGQTNFVHRAVNAPRVTASSQMPAASLAIRSAMSSILSAGAMATIARPPITSKRTSLPD